MIESNNPMSINGNWSITVDTPFGKEKYSLNIDNTNDNLSGSIFHEKGTANLINIFYLDQVFKCSLNVEFPIKATINLNANLINGNKMFGTLIIDEYLETLFVGVKQ
jgi:hypothetical protein